MTIPDPVRRVGHGVSSDAPDIPALREADIEDLLQSGPRALEWIARYLSHPDRYPVLSQVAPGELRARLPVDPPRHPEPLERILADLDTLIVPGLTHWNHPRFFAYFAITATAPGIIGELLTAAVNVNGMLWRTSPAATELEQVALDWLRRMIGLPAAFEGVIMDTASTGTLCALAAAREAVPGIETRRNGLAGYPPLCIYASADAHSSVEKACLVLGIGQAGFRKIPTDDRYCMDVGALVRAVSEDRAAGRRPCAVVATVGTTSTTSIDPVPAIARVSRSESMWLHVDAAYGGAAAILPEARHVLEGADLADSVVVNPHKWLATPIDCSALYCRTPEVLKRAFSLVPDYLHTPEAAPNFMDYGIALGRRFRALKLWMVMRYYGWDRLAAIIRQHMAWAQVFTGWVDAHAQFERMAPVPFSVVCFRLRPTEGAADRDLDALNARLLDRLNATGQIFLSHTRLRDRFTLRLAIGNYRTTFDDVRAAWDLICREAAECLGDRAASRVPASDP